MDIYTLDFETYFDATYSLRSKEYNTSEYIRDPKFKTQCVGIKKNDDPVMWYRDSDVALALHSIDWDNSALLCHNLAFDGLILSHHYGIVPAYCYDTLSMARALHSNAIGAGLDEVARFYKVGNKLPDVLDKTKGIRDLDPILMTALGQYCAVDVELTWHIFKLMRDRFPQGELDLIDMTMRMFIDPVLLVDTQAVEEELARELKEKEETIAACGLSAEELRSGAKFAAALREAGVEPPEKISPTTGKLTHAFAKGDVDFIALLEHDNPTVVNLVNARIAAKSSINETRAYRFLKAGANGAKLPVMLKFWGAHTGRWSAGNKMNMQNLPSSRSKSKGALRKAILAPKGYKIVVCDSAQIEARVNAWLAGQEDLLESFRLKRDVYSEFATEVYNYPVDKSLIMERAVGKKAILGLGYGMGAEKFKKTLKVDTPSVDLPLIKCVQTVRKYRQKYPMIAQAWRTVEGILLKMSMGQNGSWKCLRWEGPFLFLPNGMYLAYPFLEAQETERGVNFNYFTLEDGMKRKFHRNADVNPIGIYGGAFWENIVQALARIIVADQMLIIGSRYRVVTMTHDEVVALAPEDEAEEALEFMINTMSTPPAWCTDLPLSAEGGYADNYSK